MDKKLSSPLLMIGAIKPLRDYRNEATGGWPKSCQWMITEVGPVGDRRNEANLSAFLGVCFKRCVAERYAAVLKAAVRAVRVQRARIRARLGAFLARFLPLRVHFLSFKERIGGLIGSGAGFSLSGQAQADDSFALAA